MNLQNELNKLGYIAYGNIKEPEILICSNKIKYDQRNENTLCKITWQELDREKDKLDFIKSKIEKSNVHKN